MEKELEQKYIDILEKRGWTVSGYTGAAEQTLATAT